MPTNKRVGRFYLSEKLGKGSNGGVFLGHDPIIDRDVAIKILDIPNSALEKKQREQQFINEARAAGRLSHPNIVTIYDASSEGGTTFIAMEFLPGQDLRTLLASGKQLDVIDTATIAAKIANALAYAHEHGVIHRDIKPANIFILPNQQPKVVDFGIARAPNRVIEGQNGEAHTLFHNNILGTPAYMSPEQASSQQVSALTDVYSLGATMYEMLTLQKPFAASDTDRLLHQIVHKTPKYPSEIAHQVPGALSRIVMKAMKKNPAERYQSAAEMERALLKFISRAKKLKRSRLNLGNGETGPAPKSGDEASIPWLNWAALFVAVVAMLTWIFR